MAVIAVDIDSTLYDFEGLAREGFLELARQRDDASLKRGAYSAWTEWRAPADACGIDAWLEVIAWAHDEEKIKYQVPYNGAVETCTELVENGHELVYISNRATERQDATYDWLFYSGFPLIGQELICTSDDKKPYLAECQYIIDDRPKTVIEFVYDRDWAESVERGAQRIVNTGPEVGDPEWSRWSGAVNTAMGNYEEGVRWTALENANKAAANAADRYLQENARKAFVPMYPYNHNLTDVPNLYLAPNWAGLRDYMIDKGVIKEGAYESVG